MYVTVLTPSYASSAVIKRDKKGFDPESTTFCVAAFLSLQAAELNHKAQSEQRGTKWAKTQCGRNVVCSRYLGEQKNAFCEAQYSKLQRLKFSYISNVLQRRN